jgi:hypothetical protein
MEVKQVRDFKPGDVVKLDRGPFIVMHTQFNKRGSWVFFGAYDKHLQVMLKNPTDTSKMQFYTVNTRGQVHNVIQTAPPSTIKKMKAILFPNQFSI